jgi:hypothetical protein
MWLSFHPCCFSISGKMSVGCMYKMFTVLETFGIIVSNYPLNMYRIKVTERKVVGLNVLLGTYIWQAWPVALLLPHQEHLYTFHVLFLYGM